MRDYTPTTGVIKGDTRSLFYGSFHGSLIPGALNLEHSQPNHLLAANSGKNREKNKKNLNLNPKP